MRHTLRHLCVAVPVAGCAVAVAALAISPTFAEQDWIPIVASTNVDPAQLVESPAPTGGWDPLVLLTAEQAAVMSTQSIPRLVDHPVRKAPLSEPRMAQQSDPPPQPPALVAPPERVRKAPEPGPAQQYCINIADAAADARFAWQKKTLGEIEQELDRRIAILEARAAEYREWLARRDEFARKAEATLVKIYARMRPDAAASQLAAMDEETAAAVLTKLDPRNASAILNEMPPGPAARLTTTIAGAARVNPDPVPSTSSGGGRS